MLVLRRGKGARGGPAVKLRSQQQQLQLKQQAMRSHPPPTHPHLPCAARRASTYDNQIRAWIKEDVIGGEITGEGVAMGGRGWGGWGGGGGVSPQGAHQEEIWPGILLSGGFNPPLLWSW